MNKRLLCFFALLLTAVMGVWADEFVVDNVRYTITSEDPNEVTVSGYDGDLPASLVIPASVTYNTTDYAVTSIGNNAFSGCTSLEYVSIPSSVTTIGNNAFSGCTSLEYVSIPSSVTTIGNNAFSGSGLSTINIPASVTSFGNNVFSGCTGLTSITINVENIVDEAFSGLTSLENVSIGMNVKTIGNNAFYGCTGLTSITTPSSVTTIGNNAFKGCTSLEFLSIAYVTSIGEGAFNGCELLSNLTIGSDVTSIGDDAFSNCPSLETITVSPYNSTYDSRNFCNAIIDIDLNKLVVGCKTTTIPNTVTSIGTNAFKGCTGLTSIDIPAGVTSIGANAFQSCTSLASVTDYSSTPPTLGDDAFDGCDNDLKIYVFSDLEGTYKTNWSAYSGIITAIPNQSGTCGAAGNEDNVTWQLDITSTTRVLTISGTGAMADWQWDSSNNKPQATPWDAYKTEITSVVIGNDVTYIGAYAFYGHTALTSVTIGSSVTTIGEDAFENCSALTAIDIPANVTSIGCSAFYGCSSLVTVNGASGLISCGSFVFSNTPWEDALSSTEVNYLGKVALLAKDGISGSVIIADGTVGIADGAFVGNPEITSVTIPASVTTIGGNAFSNCSALETVTFEAGSQLATIGESVFNYCSALESITIPAGVTTIGNNAFNSCADLVSVTFAESSQLETISEGVFFECSALTSITIPASVTTIGDGAFYECTKLATVTLLRSTPPSIGNQTFYNIGKNAYSYKKFYFHGTAYGTDTYSDWNNMYNHTGSFDDWTTTVIGTLTLSEGTTTSTAAFVSDATSNYYTEGTTITLGHGDAPEGKVFAGYTVKDANDNDVIVTETADVYTFNMPDGDVTATVNWREIIPYIDADGNTAYCTDYTVLDNTMTTISEGWYVVNSDVTISGNLSTNVSSSGEVNIILCDGATLTASKITPINDSDFLRIYGQSQGTGTASISGNIDASSSLKIYGGTINVTGTIMCYQSGVGIYGGNVTATDINGFEGDLYLKDGIITVGRLTVDQGNIILAGATVKSNSYNASGNITILPGITYYNGSEVLTGTVSEMSKLNGMTLSPAVPYIDADGTTAYCTDFTVLTGSTKSVTLGSDGETTWYVVNSDVNYKTILLIGNVNFILCDGMTMTSDGGSASAISGEYGYNNSLTIYDQTAGTGKLVARCGEGNGISSDDITINGGTVDANGSDNCSAIYADGNITISGGNVSATGYPTGIEAGGTITLGWTNATDRIYSTSYSGTVIVKDGQVFTDGNGNNFFGTITDVSTIADKTLQPAANSVFYIDEDGTTKCCTDYTVLTGGEATTLYAGWYVVNDDVTYTGTVTLNGDVTIILCDGKTMNVGTATDRISDSGIVKNNDRSLTIYGQSGQTGRLNVYNDDSNKAAVDLWCYNQYGGNVNIDANYAALSLHDSDGTFELSLQRGTLTVTAANGKDAIKCNTVVYGVLMEGGTLAATSIGGTAINGRVNFRGGTLTANGGDSGCGISGYVSLIPYSGFDSFTASSFNSDVSIAYGKSVSDGTTIYTNSNQSEIKSLKNVTLTLPTCSLTGNSVVTGEYWSTFYHPTAGYQVDANTTTAYIATLNSEETALTLTEVEGGFIPAGHAVILKSTTSSYDIDRAETGDAFDFTTNSLLGGGKVNPTYDVYTLAAKDGVVGFYKFTGTSLNPYKAHLECAPADSRDYYGLEDDGTTNVDVRSKMSEGRGDVWYDLNGRRIEKPTRKGIYIHNGRKEVLK